MDDEDEIEYSEIVEIHGMHESQEGLCLWGYGLWNNTCSELDRRLFNTKEEAEKALKNGGDA